MRAPIGRAIPDDILVEESGTHRARAATTQDIPLHAAAVAHRRDHQQRDRGQPRPGRSAGRSRFPHGLWSVRPGRRPGAHRDPARARSPRSEAQAPRSVLRLGQQGAVPHDRPRAARHARQAAPGEWEKIVIMGKQIAPEDADVHGRQPVAAASVGVDLNLEGGESRVDFDLFGEPDVRAAATSTSSSTSGERKATGRRRRESRPGLPADEPKRGVDEEPTREFDRCRDDAGDADHRERRRSSSPQTRATSRRSARRSKARCRPQSCRSDQTAGLAIDDLGLELGSLDTPIRWRRTRRRMRAAPLRDDEMTQLAPSIEQFRSHAEGAAREVRHRDHRHDLHRPGRSRRRRHRRAAASRTRTRPRR